MQTSNSLRRYSRHLLESIFKFYIDISGDHVNIIANMRLGGFEEEDFSFTIIVNQQIANSFRAWFHYM
ncbi:MAG TPA: hypothetical protein VJB65_04650 [Patescibacteria group bacterium]|nr:hypothetical protein [Patescibacteria group bacterium]